MATQKQIAANRRNATQSTGPRSDEGKAQSALNALKTGIDARSQIIRGESKAALDELSAEYRQRFRTSTPEQRALVDALIDCEWILRRLRAVETQLWENAMYVFDINPGEAFRRNCDTFARLQRRIDSTQRHYHTALRELHRLQSAENAPCGSGPAPVTPCVQTSNPENGFVPQSLSEPVESAAPCPVPVSAGQADAKADIPGLTAQRQPDLHLVTTRCLC